MARGRPTKAKLSALVKEDKEQEETWLGSLWSLGSIQKKEHKGKGMM